MVSASSAEDWKSRYKPIADWDGMFADGKWDYLDSAGEAPRYAVIAGYIHRQPNPGDVLDVGCGAGLLCRYLDRSRVGYSGIDVSATAIEQARKRFSSCEFQTCDVADYNPPEQRTFGAVVFNEVLPHIADPLGALRRYLTFLAPGGIALISTYQNPNLRSNAAMFTQMLDDVVRRGEFRALGGCEVVTSDKGYKWRVDVIAAEAGCDAQR